MSYNDESSGRIIVDLETAPILDAALYIEPGEAPSNYKDPLKITAFVADEQRKQLDRAALDPDLCRVVAVGLMDDCGSPQLLMANDEASEAAMLQLVWDAISERIIVGFNVLAFDALVLLRRSLYLRVQAPRLQVERFKHPRIIDLMTELSFNGLLKYHSLDFYCRRLALDVPADETTGADIPGLIAAGDWDAVRAHLRVDVLKTAALAERLGHMTFIGTAEVVL